MSEPTSSQGGSTTVAKNVLHTIVGNYSEYLVGLVCSILIARTLAPELYGEYAFLIWLCGFSVALVNTGIATSLINFVAKYKTKSTAEAKAVYEFMSGMQRQKLLLAVVPIFLVFWLSYEGTGWVPMAIACMLTAAVIVKAYHMFRVSTFKGLERYDGIAKVALFVAPLQLISAASLWYIEAPLWSFLVQYLFVTLLMNVVSFVLLRRMQYAPATSHEVLDQPAIKAHVRSLTPSELIAFLTTASIGLVFLKFFSTPDTVAFYNIGVMVATAVISLVPGLVDMLLLPIVSRTISSAPDDLSAVFRTTTRHLLQLTLLVAGPIFLFGEAVIGLAYGDEYASAAKPLYWLTLFMALAHFGRMIYTYLISSEQQGLLVKIAVFSLITMVLLNALLVPWFQLEGAIAAFAISTVIITGVNYYLVRNLLPFSFEPGLYVRSIGASVCAGATIYYLIGSYAHTAPVIALGSIGFGVLMLLLMTLFRAFGPDDTKAISTLIAEWRSR